MTRIGRLFETASRWRRLRRSVGKMIEAGAADHILDTPRHPYTRGLISCIPVLDDAIAQADRPPPLVEIPGVVPPLHLLGAGCAFAARCHVVHDACDVAPALQGAPHAVACHLHADEARE